MAPDADNAAARLAQSASVEYSAVLRRYLLRRVARRQDADDLAQEVYSRLLRVRDAELIRNPQAYVLGIAAHVVYEYRQRQGQSHVLFDSEVADSAADQPAGRSPGPAESLAIRDQLDKALRQLPPTHQLVLLLVKRDGLSHREAAEASGLSVHTIEKYLVEARARLRVILSGPEA